MVVMMIVIVIEVIVVLILLFLPHQTCESPRAICNLPPNYPSSVPCFLGALAEGAFLYKKINHFCRVYLEM
jgi:hypothetical protein